MKQIKIFLARHAVTAIILLGISCSWCLQVKFSALNQFTDILCQALGTSFVRHKQFQLSG